MQHAITTPEFLVLFFAMFIVVGALDWLVRRFGSPQVKALFLTGDYAGFGYSAAGTTDMDARVRKLEADLAALQKQ